VEAIKKGTPLAEAGKLGTTNGAAMKIGPMGLITPYRDLPALVQQVAEICVPTHNTQVAIQGAAVVAAAVNYLFQNERADWDEFYTLLAQAVTLSAPYGNQLPTPDMGQRLSYSRQLADDLAEDDFLKQLYTFLGTGLPTIETVPAAIALVYRYRGDLTQAVEAAANIGGDTDTIGAICGAICGGYHYNLVPAMAQQLADVNQLGLERLAQQLAPIVGKGL
jgi:ADP-ribosylglycohydrolase